MNIKSMRGYIVPLATVFVLAVSTACPVQAVDSIAEIMAEDSETVIVGESDLMIEDASEAEDVIAEEPDSAFENAAETEEVTAEEPTLIIDESSDYESAIVEDPDSIADSTLEGDEVMESVGESDGSGTVEDPTVLAGEEAAYYDDPSKAGAQWIKGPFSPFPDVQDAKHAYYQAICWAGNNGIAKGYSDGAFRSGGNCTRGEAMMFLWRTVGKPSPRYVRKSPFPDVPMTRLL